jgi:hypothetical protein
MVPSIINNPYSHNPIDARPCSKKVELLVHYNRHDGLLTFYLKLIHAIFKVLFS